MDLYFGFLAYHSHLGLATHHLRCTLTSVEYFKAFLKNGPMIWLSTTEERSYEKIGIAERAMKSGRKIKWCSRNGGLIGGIVAKMETNGKKNINSKK